jgi:hypothetical protein
MMAGDEAMEDVIQFHDRLGKERPLFGIAFLQALEQGIALIRRQPGSLLRNMRKHRS